MTDYKDRISGWATYIDWSKAPEWATKHGIAGTYREHPIWFNDTQYTYCDEQQEGKVFQFSYSCVYKPKDIYAITDRPAPQWSGEGLPPVGTECECRVTAGADWVPCVVVAHHKQYAIAYVDDDTVMLSCGIRFRPRRTPAHIAAEEREAAIDEMAGWAGLTGPPIDHERKILGRLYDGNYRRMTKGDDK